MILGPPPEPLRGDVLRMALRALCLPPMPPPREEPPAPEPPPDKGRRTDKFPVGWNNDPAARQLIKEGRAKALAEAMKKRPRGMITRQEAADLKGLHRSTIDKHLRRHKIKPFRKEPLVTWFSKKKLKRAGIIPALAMMLLHGSALAQDCRPITELLVEAMLRGEELKRVLGQPDGSVQALLAGPSSWTLLRVTEGSDIDQACVEAKEP